jgi:outer membrane protein TolC
MHHFRKQQEQRATDFFDASRSDERQTGKMRFSVCIWSTLVFGTVMAAMADQSLSLHSVINTALQENPTIKAARAKWEMIKARVPQAIAWEDPRLGFNSVAGRFVSVPANAFMDQSVVLEQELPISGKNRSRARAATAEAGATFEEFRRAELDVVSRARAAYSRLANGYAQLEVNQRNEGLLNDFIKISQSKYESGTATQSDVLLAETDLAKLLETRAEIQRQISDEQSMLNVLMNRPAQTPLGRPAALIFTPHKYSLKSLQAISLISRPEIQQAQSMIDSARFGVELAHRQWVPDPMVNITALRYNEASQAVSELDMGISIPLPWLNRKKYSAGIVEAGKSLENAQRGFDATRTEALGLVRDQLKKIQTAASQYELYRDKIIPLANDAVEASRAAYESATGGFLELITARRNLQDAESMGFDRLAEYEVAIAELDAITGNLRPNEKDGSK